MNEAEKKHKKEYDRQYYLKNRAMIRARSKAYYMANKERIREYNKLRMREKESNRKRLQQKRFNEARGWGEPLAKDKSAEMYVDKDIGTIPCCSNCGLTEEQGWRGDRKCPRCEAHSITLWG